MAVYYKSVNRNPLTPLLRFVVALLYNLFLQFSRSFDRQSASRGPSAVAELLVDKAEVVRYFVCIYSKTLTDSQLNLLHSAKTNRKDSYKITKN